ncbi:alpha/beta-hydrolase [Collybia nuda]|uniref:Alpha/beta-hydrolase n=1 Tax=Collybia nuda TaxID=64659 RepID=A0A9P5Y2P7_9AGAR|nr:alpha/beta-hydrolase [Collybia nuda]
MLTSRFSRLGDARAFLQRATVIYRPCSVSTTSLKRPFSSSLTRHSKVVELDYVVNIPPDGNKTEGSLVILHGLFGSKRNFTTLSRAFMKELNIPVYALDLRNQGTSPHVEPMTYSYMAMDVLHFLNTHSLTNITLLGHSMGGKAAMAVALHPSLETSNSGILSNLIVADVAPTRAQLSGEFKQYVKAMKEIEQRKLKTKKEVLEVLQTYEKDSQLCAFLMTNLEPMTAAKPYAKFRVPLDTLGDAITEIGSFPYAPGERTWSGPTMFIKGSKSAYINRHNMPDIEAFFPTAALETLDAGHWVHGDRPAEFKQLVVDFIKRYSTR